MLEQYNKLIGTLYRAAHEPDGWKKFLDGLIAFTGSYTGLLTIQNEESGRIEYLLQSGFDESVLKIWEEHYFALDLWTQQGVLQPKNQFLNGDALVPRKEYLKSEIFNDYGRHVGMYHAGGGYFCSPTNRNTVRIAFQQDKEQGSTSDEAMIYLQMLAPHLEQALHLSEHLLSRSSTVSDNLLNALPYPVFICDQHRRVVSLNEHGAEFVGCNSPIRIHNKRLKLIDHGMNKHLATAVHQKSNLLHNESSIVTFKHRQAEYVLKIIPWIDTEDHFPLKSPRVIVMIKPVHEIFPVDAGMLRLVFGFSARESEVSQALSQGFNVKDITGMFGLKESTIRSHIKSVLWKTNSRSQHQLVALLHSVIR